MAHGHVEDSNFRDKERVRRQAPARARGAAGSGGPALLKKSQKYLSEVMTELKKANWPTRSELIAQTRVVLGLLVLIGVFIASWDFILGRVFDLIMALMRVPQL